MTVVVDGTLGVSLSAANSVPAGALQSASVAASNLIQPFTAGTAQSTTSGTFIDFTGIPSWVKRITVMLNGFGTSGTSNYQIQLGSGSIDATSYVGTCSSIQSSAATTQGGTTGFYIVVSSNITSTTTAQGTITLCLLGSNTWTESGNLSRDSGAGTTFFSAGSKTLSGTLDRIRLTTANGTDTLRVGSVNILYE